MKKKASSVFVIAMSGLMGITAQAQQKVPSGKEVIERFVSVTGGREKYENIKTTTLKGTLRIPQANLAGTIEVYFSDPDKLRINVDIKGIGKVEQGVNGAVGWEASAATGNRLIPSEEAERLVESIQMKTALEPESIYETMNNKGIEEVGGEKCYKLEMKRKDSGDVDYNYYSVETGLLTKSVSMQPSQFGKIEVEVTVSDYTEVDGVKSASRIIQEMAALGMTQEIDIESTKYNEKIEDSVFELPAEIKKLLKSSSNSESSHRRLVIGGVTPRIIIQDEQEDELRIDLP